MFRSHKKNKLPGNKLLQHAINSTNEGIVITDALDENNVIYVNNAFARLTGYSIHEILGQNLRLLQGDDRNQAARYELQKAIATGEACRVEIRNYRKNGEMFWDELSLSPIRNKRGKITHFVGIQKDITKRKELEETLYNQSITDPLTGVYNRRGFDIIASKQIAFARRAGQTLSLILVDLDNFKEINEKYGRLQGDEALVATAKILSRTFRHADVVARFGGDEFVILTSETKSSHVSVTLNRLTDAMNAFNTGSHLPFKLSFSSGVAHLAPDKEKDIPELLHEADLMMYNVKKKAHPHQESEDQEPKI